MHTYLNKNPPIIGLRSKLKYLVRNVGYGDGEAGFQWFSLVKLEKL